MNNERLDATNLIKLKLVGFDEAKQGIFESIFNLAESRLASSWEITTSKDDATFYLFACRLNQQLAQYLSLKKIPDSQCIFCTDTLKDVNHHQLLVDKNNIPYLRYLIDLFNKISNNPRTNTAPSKLTTPNKIAEIDTKKNHSNYFNPEEHPFISCLTAGNSEDIYKFNLNNCPPLYIDFINQCYYTTDTLESLQSYFNADASYQLQTLTIPQLNNFVHQQNLNSQPLKNLIWYSTFICSQGKVLYTYQVDDVVRLKRWPDINLSCCKNLIKLAAYLQSNASNLQTAQLKTQIDLDQIYNFYNACEAIHLIEHCPKVDLYEKDLDNMQRELYQKIGQRLSYST